MVARGSDDALIMSSTNPTVGDSFFKMLCSKIKLLIRRWKGRSDIVNSKAKKRKRFRVEILVNAPDDFCGVVEIINFTVNIWTDFMSLCPRFR